VDQLLLQQQLVQLFLLQQLIATWLLLLLSINHQSSRKRMDMEKM
jgi:hypothetical protein